MIIFPETFPIISEKDILTPISQWEISHGIKGYVRDYPANKPIETEREFERKFRKTLKKVSKILKKLKE